MRTLESTAGPGNALPRDFNSDRLVSPKVTAELLALSPATLQRLWREGRGPRRIQISQRRFGVRLRDIQAYLDRAAV
jgi:hypothetical protein